MTPIGRSQSLSTTARAVVFNSTASNAYVRFNGLKSIDVSHLQVGSYRVVVNMNFVSSANTAADISIIAIGHENNDDFSESWKGNCV